MKQDVVDLIRGDAESRSLEPKKHPAGAGGEPAWPAGWGGANSKSKRLPRTAAETAARHAFRTESARALALGWGEQVQTRGFVDGGHQRGGALQRGQLGLLICRQYSGGLLLEAGADGGGLLFQTLDAQHQFADGRGVCAARLLLRVQALPQRADLLKNRLQRGYLGLLQLLQAGYLR